MGQEYTSACRKLAVFLGNPLPHSTYPDVVATYTGEKLPLGRIFRGRGLPGVDLSSEKNFLRIIPTILPATKTVIHSEATCTPELSQKHPYCTISTPPLNSFAGVACCGPPCEHSHAATPWNLAAARRIYLIFFKV